MLSIDHQMNIGGYTVYRDLQNDNQYFYLPSEKPKIAGNGKKLQLVVYTDGEILEGSSPDFNEDDRIGAFLTLEVELGPTPAEVMNIQNQLNSAVGREVNLAQVPFKDGTAELQLLRVSSNNQGGENQAVEVTFAATAKPSLMGLQTTVFSAKLGNKEAQIMWNLLQEGNQTQAAVVYNLKYLGVMPAKNLEITIDFKATEDFWNHNIDFDGSVEFGDKDKEGKRNKVAAKTDIDIMIRKLVNEGAIQIKQIIYEEGQATNQPLGADDPNALKLIKELMGPTLFRPTAIPNEQYTALKNAAKQEDNKDEKDADGDDEKEGGPTVVTEKTPKGPNTGDKRDPEKEKEKEKDKTDGSSSGEAEKAEGEKSKEEGEKTEEPRGERKPKDAKKTDEAGKTDQGKGEKKTESKDKDEDKDKKDAKSPDEVDDPHFNVSMGYTLKRREISEQIKRTYRFEQSEAKIHNIYPQATLSVEGTDFDPETQVQLVRLGEGPFKEIEIEARASFDFEDFNIQEAIVHIAYGYAEEEGDRSRRLHEFSLTLQPNENRRFARFFVDQYGTQSYDYYVEFIHKPGSIIGTHETRITSQVFEDITERDISVNMSAHSPLIPVEVQAGNLQFNPDGIRSVQVYLAPDRDGNGRTTILNSQSPALAKYLIFPRDEDTYEYFKREEFFFQEEVVEFEYEDVRDSQVIVNSPDSHIFTIAPTLVANAQQVQQVLVDVRYTNAGGEIKQTILNLTPQDSTQQFAVPLEDGDPRQWEGRSRFVLTNGTILNGEWINYETAEPLINLESSGFRPIQIVPLLGEATFMGSIVAIQVSVYDQANPTTTRETVFLRNGKHEDQVIVEGVGANQPLFADLRIFRRDGSSEEQTTMLPPGMSELLLMITDV